MAIYEHIHTNIYTFDDRFETQISKQKGHHVKRLQATNGGGEMSGLNGEGTSSRQLSSTSFRMVKHSS